MSRRVTPYQLSSSFPAWINHTNFTRTNPYVTRKMLVCAVCCGCPQDCIRIRVIKYFISFTERNKGSFLFTSSWEWKVATLYLGEEIHVRTKASLPCIIVLRGEKSTQSEWLNIKSEKKQSHYFYSTVWFCITRFCRWWLFFILEWQLDNPRHSRYKGFFLKYNIFGWDRLP